jgi:hypothetical protein
MGARPQNRGQPNYACYGPEATFASLWPNGSKVRIADLYAKRSEGPVSALRVDRHERPKPDLHDFRS